MKLYNSDIVSKLNTFTSIVVIEISKIKFGIDKFWKSQQLNHMNLDVVFIKTAVKLLVSMGISSHLFAG